MKEDRTERIALAEKRDMMYEKFRTNVRVLRALKGLSGVECSREMGLKDGKRLVALEYGRSNPTIEEVMSISKYFNHTMDEIMNKDAIVKFE